MSSASGAPAPDCAHGRRQSAAELNDRTDGRLVGSGPVGADHTGEQFPTGLVVERPELDEAGTVQFG
jgi:hypothetical protein